ncbi:MAG: translation elongation factor Ts [Kiritimatiellae bacterium]|nr:translation elongation factor Ts [Kiritimatiellia bacterium]
MADITAAMVKELRNATNVSMMDCKRALVETDGDADAATKLLRERGVAVAAKRAARVANEGIVASSSSEDGNTMSLVEVNSETDFVAKNDHFKAFVNLMADNALDTDEALAEKYEADVTAKRVEIGENITVRRNVRFVLEGTGAVASYIHMGGKVGVLVEVTCENEATVEKDEFKALLSDLNLHIAACAPQHLNKDEVPADVVASEKEIFVKQVEGKPEHIIDQIVNGKLEKFYGEICLVSQGFVKEPKQSITALLEEVGKAVEDKLTISRFVRYQLGL